MNIPKSPVIIFRNLKKKMLRVEDKYVRSPQSFKRSPESGIGINKSLIGKPTLSNVEGVEFWGFGSEGRKL